MTIKYSQKNTRRYAKICEPGIKKLNNKYKTGRNRKIYFTQERN